MESHWTHCLSSELTLSSKLAGPNSRIICRVAVDSRKSSREGIGKPPLAKPFQKNCHEHKTRIIWSSQPMGNCNKKQFLDSPLGETRYQIKNELQRTVTNQITLLTTTPPSQLTRRRGTSKRISQWLHQQKRLPGW